MMIVCIVEWKLSKASWLMGKSDHLVPTDIWGTVVQRVAKLREEAGMLKLFTDHVKGEEMYGLRIHAVMRITESVSKKDYSSMLIIPH